MYRLSKNLTETEEQRFSQSGLVDSKTRLEIGKLLGVHQIIEW